MTEHLTLYLNNTNNINTNNTNIISTNSDQLNKYISKDNKIILYIPDSISIKNNIIKKQIRISID